jgi:predicted ATPase
MAQVWQATFLGAFSLERGGQRIERLRSLKMEALFARLALAPDRQFSRDELIAYLWPDDSIEVGQNNLRVALSRLRQTLGAGVVEGSRTHVQLCPGAVQTDVVAFEAAVRRGDAIGALSLYHGPYLPGVYDDHTVAERERLEALAERMRERAARLETSPTHPPLPTYLTRFLVRERERDELAALVREKRLVTLLGPGGIGKTRLATETARCLADAFSLVAFIPLDECFEAARLPERICATLGMCAAQTPPLTALTVLLHERPALLVLDNLEQLVESGVGEVIEQLLTRIPTLRILATSRVLPGVPGEQVFPLASLTSEQSLALFLDRARVARPHFTPAADQPIAALCARLDGIPLALELAASRLRSQSVVEILEQLARSEKPLRQPGDKQTRHASLDDAIAWSWRLLPTHQQAFLAQLSVFQGGWTAAAAAAVTGYTDATERLSALTDASLVVAEETVGGRMRFRFLETIRAFATARLPFEQRQEARYQHRRFFAARVGIADYENVVGALTSALEDVDAPGAHQLLIQHGQTLRGYIGAKRCLALCDAVLALPLSDPQQRILALAATIPLTGDRGDWARADALLQEAWALAGDAPHLRARALLIQAQLAIGRYDPPEASIALLEEAAALAVSVNDDSLCGQALRSLGIQLHMAHRYDDSVATLLRAETLLEAAGDTDGLRHARQSRAVALLGLDRREEALTLHRECLALARAAGDWSHEGFVLNNLGWTLDKLGRHQEALEQRQDALKLFYRLGNLRGMALVFWNVSDTLITLGHRYEGVAMLRFASAFWTTHVGPLTDEDIESRNLMLAEAALQTEPSALTFDDARALLLSL